jgi:hypothetical protein
MLIFKCTDNSISWGTRNQLNTCFIQLTPRGLTRVVAERCLMPRCSLALPMMAPHHFWPPDCSSTRSATCSANT